MTRSEQFYFANKLKKIFIDVNQFNDTNFFPRMAAQEALQDYHKHIKYEGNDLILDVGSGSGNVTSEIYVPKIPRSDFRLVGVDILKHMVDFATKNNFDKRLTYRVLDINEKDENIVKSVFTNEELKRGFNVVVSFICLNWAHNYHQSYKNIYTLMKPGGQVFTLNIAYSSYVEIFDYIRRLEKWQSFVKNVPVFTFPYHYSEDPAKECTEMLKQIGFEDIQCFLDQKYQLPEDPQHLPMKNVLRYANPYLHLIPSSLHSLYMEDVIQAYQKLIKIKPGLPYDRLIVVAKKPF